jgi:hypothetical protein
MTAHNASAVIFEWSKGSGTHVRVEIASLRGRSFLNVREWVFRADAWVPTQRGVTLPLAAMRGLYQALAEPVKTYETHSANLVDDG